MVLVSDTWFSKICNNSSCIYYMRIHMEEAAMSYLILLCAVAGILPEALFHLPVRKDKQARVYRVCSVD